MSSYHSGPELPVPDDDQIAHSQQLIERIIQRIESAGGIISFRDYMQACLYEPGLGYYAAGSTKFGAAGDFVTAPEVSSLFGASLANHAAGLFADGLARQILEFGAGTGKLCGDIAQRLGRLDIDLQDYLILEPSADLQQRQQQYCQQHLSEQDFEKIQWLDKLPESFSGLVIGNEVLDAMPVNVLVKDADWLELGVGFNGKKFEWREFSRQGEAVESIRGIDVANNLPNRYCTEVNLNYRPWCKSLADSCHQAVVLMIDYGYEQSQYYHPGRNTGTLVCHYQHRVHPDPLIYPGLQDITAFVDFDAFADAALAAGFELGGMYSQAEFLINNGLLELMQSSDVDEMQQLALAQQVKTLTLPGEMGEKFKVIKLHKGIEFCS